mmetsp:Transcript_14258/g.20712  ORF Transcript_14258/g.20712 Transcript_14258/m.20712 type:complete len:296 (-) Transcript_14258:232-1119(-)
MVTNKVVRSLIGISVCISSGSAFSTPTAQHTLVPTVQRARSVCHVPGSLRLSSIDTPPGSNEQRKRDIVVKVLRDAVMGRPNGSRAAFYAWITSKKSQQKISPTTTTTPTTSPSSSSSFSPSSSSSVSPSSPSAGIGQRPDVSLQTTTISKNLAPSSSSSLSSVSSFTRWHHHDRVYPDDLRLHFHHPSSRLSCSLPRTSSSFSFLDSYSSSFTFLHSHHLFGRLSFEILPCTNVPSSSSSSIAVSFFFSFNLLQHNDRISRISQELRHLLKCFRLLQLQLQLHSRQQQWNQQTH